MLKESDAALKHSQQDAEEKGKKLGAEEKRCLEKEQEITNLTKENQNWSHKYTQLEQQHETNKNNVDQLTKQLQAGWTNDFFFVQHLKKANLHAKNVSTSVYRSIKSRLTMHKMVSKKKWAKFQN